MIYLYPWKRIAIIFSICDFLNYNLYQVINLINYIYI
jgi:hypothetical protein